MCLHQFVMTSVHDSDLSHHKLKFTSLWCGIKARLINLLNSNSRKSYVSKES